MSANKSINVYISFMTLIIVAELLFLFNPFKAKEVQGPPEPPKVSTISGITEILQTSPYRPSFIIWRRSHPNSSSFMEELRADHAEILYDVPVSEDAWITSYGRNDSVVIHLHHTGELGGTDTGGKSHEQITPLK